MVKNPHYEQKYNELQKVYLDCVQELREKDQEIATLHAHIDQLNIQVSSIESTAGLAKKLFNRVDGKIIAALNRKGARKLSVKRDHPTLVMSDQDSLTTLTQKTYEYDVDEFFTARKKLRKSNLRIHYRIVAKSYRTSRDIGKILVANAYRSLKREA